jgi:hypothetical protein
MSFMNNLQLSLPTLPNILAAPMDYRLEDIQCRCLALSSTTKPTPCTYLEPHDLDWQTAYSVASDNGLQVQFAHETTITKILSIPRPLPKNVLQTVLEGEALPLDSTERVKVEDKMICGLGNEVNHIASQEKGLEPVHYAGVVLGSLMMLLIIYLIGECLWIKYVSTMLTRTVWSLISKTGSNHEINASSSKATKRP